MSEIKAIETRYAGCRFRSRLEARWAVFFDTLGIPWEYEPQGYETPGGRYLPDFWLPSLDLWAEVKGEFTHDDFLRTVEAVPYLREPADTVTPQLLILGSVPAPGRVPLHSCFATWGDHLLWLGTFFSHWAGQWRLDAINWPAVFPAGRVAAWRNESTEVMRASAVAHGYDDRLLVDPAVDDAYRAARSARFEHGERG